MKLNLLLFLILIFSASVFAQLTPEPVAEPDKDTIRSKAIYLGRPQYPPVARYVKASGTVAVKVTVDEQGNVISAEAQTGHPLLRSAAVKAALESKFTPTLKDGKPVKLTGTIDFNFATFEDNSSWEFVGGNLITLLNNRSPIATKVIPKNAIWKGLDEEYTEYISFLESEELGDKPKRAGSLLNLLRYKLKSRESSELWYLNLGVATAGLNFNDSTKPDDGIFYTYLNDLNKLVETAPADLPQTRLQTLTKIAKYNNEKNITKEQKSEIVRILIESRNAAMNGAK